MKESIHLLNKTFANASIEDVLKYFLSTYGEKIALASSFGAEDQVLTDLILKEDAKAKIFTLDTGRLYEQTYKVMDLTNRKYNIKIDVLFPHAKDVETLYQTQGINGFKESIENRKECCHIRKILPLKRALSTLDVWITGLRRSQSQTRESMKLVEFDEGNNLIKINPLIEWSEEEVWDYLKQHKVPYNELHEQGYPSIGCAPCTRAVASGEDVRSGRWWWESPEHKECGLHLKNN